MVLSFLPPVVSMTGIHKSDRMGSGIKTFEFLVKEELKTEIYLKNWENAEIKDRSRLI